MGRCAKLLPRSRTGKVSIRSPHKQEETFIKIRNCVTIDGFNPLPSQKQGETYFKCPRCKTSYQFQSAPLTKARGDIGLRDVDRLSKRFNPLPSQKQGETQSSMRTQPSQSVSIRSPHKSKGRPDRARLFSASALFQSAPLTKARGDCRGCCRRDQFVSVSIRSPHKSKGRQPGWILVCIFLPFQSAPLTKARGDELVCTWLAVGYCFNPLPSQKQGETFSSEGCRLGRFVSIRSPHKSKGRRLRRPRLRGHCPVSIRSPHKSKGRLMPVA